MYAGPLHTSVYVFLFGILLSVNLGLEQWRIQAVRETGIPVCAPKLWRPKAIFEFSFFSWISTKVAVNDFTMHLIILK